MVIRCSAKTLIAMIGCIMLTWFATAAGTCLPNGVIPELRKNLTNSQGESFPVGVILQPYSSAELAHEVLAILISEVLGYSLWTDPHVPASAIDLMFAMVGCKTWFNRDDRGCEERKIELHLAVESWHFSYPNSVESMRQTYPAEMPLSADMGYMGDTGQYISADAVEAAQSTRGLALEYHKQYDPKWHKAIDFFDNISVANTSYFFKCEESSLNDNATIFGYWKWTGDDGGVVIVDNHFKAYCPDGHFWRAPVCRNDPTQCILYVTGGDGWQLDVMQRTAAFSIPLGIAVANSWDNYLLVPKTYKTMFFSWTPDDSLLDLNPVNVIFPPHNAFAHAQGELSTASSRTPLAKLTSYDLGYLAPDLFELLKNSAFDINLIYSLMRQKKDTGETAKEVACNWLKKNEARWSEWIPDPTLCIRGFGLYDATTETFSSSRQAATTCKACLPGTYSKRFADDQGNTYVCEECPAGKQQPAAGEVNCDLCPAGTSKAVKSTEDCAPCRAGYYQNDWGAETCKKCPEGTTTVLLRATQVADCVCIEGTIDVSTSGATHCVPCTDGLSCPDGSTVEKLKIGSTDDLEKNPEIASGYFSWMQDPTEVFKCPGTHCPGGRPGTCEGGRLGPTCDECGAGMYWADDECRSCEVSIVAAWVAGPVLVLLAMVLAYYVTDETYKARASLGECATIGGDMMVAFVQQLGILSAVSVPWPVTLKNLFQFSSVFVLNLQSLGFSCASSGGVQQYAMSALFFIAVATAMPCLGYLTQICSCMRHRGLNWDFYKTICVTGKFLQSGFTTMCNIGLVPFMCFLHPNGRRSILKYPHTFCGSSEHGMMQLFGILVLVLSLTHFILCCWASWKAPTWSVVSPKRIRGIGFFIGNFRPSSWWFGLVLLTRGPLLSLPVVLAPNTHGIQLASMLCVLLVSFAWQLWFLPWKAPILNLVDAISTALFLILLAVSLHLEPAVSNSLSFLDSLGTGMYFVSLGVIACVSIFAFGLVLWQRCCSKRRLLPSIVNLGRIRDPEEILETLLAVTGRLECKDEKEKQVLLRKMSSSVSACDLSLLGQALDILIADCELGVVDLDSKIVGRVAAKRISHMSKRSLEYLRSTGRTSRASRDVDADNHNVAANEAHELESECASDFESVPDEA